MGIFEYSIGDKNCMWSTGIVIIWVVVSGGIHSHTAFLGYCLKINFTCPL